MRTARLRAALLAAGALLTACGTSQPGTGTAALGTPAATPTATTPASTTPASATPPSVAPVVSSSPAVTTTAAPPNPCAGNKLDQLVKVSLHAQQMWMCHGTTLARETPITSGAAALPYDSTPTGNFHIQGRDTHTLLTLNTGAQYHVKYWIPFSAPLFGFHDASWQTIPYGSQKYRTDGSHGCIHMPLTAIQFFYHWVHLGATVHIRT